MNVEKAMEFIHTNGRLLERRAMEYVLSGGSREGVVAAVRAYQNGDGGFGHALEPDVRAPGSQPLHVEFALRLLHDCGIKEEELAVRTCEYVKVHSDLKAGIPTLLPSARSYARAEHWNHPGSEEPSFSRLTGLVGLLRWQGVEHPWLEQATEMGLLDMASRRYTDAHTILTAFCLLESLPQTDRIQGLFHKLAEELLQADFFQLVPSAGYGVTPLEFAPAADSYCRSIFTDEILEAHLRAMEREQEEDGGWPIPWSPPGTMSLLEWRAYKTLRSVMTWTSYQGRLL